MQLAIFLSCAALLPAAVQRDVNRITVDDPNGAVAIEFSSPVSFYYQRIFAGAAQQVRGAPLSLDSQSIAVKETENGAILTTRYLEVIVADGGVRVRTTSGREVMSMTGAATKTGFQLKVKPGEIFHGLGSTGGPHPLISSNGYGIFAPSSSAHFEFAANGHLVSNQTIFQFYYGRNPKEILEQHMLTTHNQVELPMSSLSTRDGTRLPIEVRRIELTEASYCDLPRILNQLSLAAVLFPAIDLSRLGRYQEYVRLLPFLYGANVPELELRRAPWLIYLEAYLREAHDRGLPIVRPLVMQIPEDKALALTSDVFMLGDEILLAPGCNVTEIDLPGGNWTDLRTNQRHRGRQKIVNDPGAGLPIFAKAGSLIPLISSRRGISMELHYYPSSGAEFFVFEEEANEYSQFHAAPSADFLRVESESKVKRTYEWVLHHTPKPNSVGETGRPYKEARTRADLQSGTWFHDTATGDLHILVESAAGEDRIVNMSF